MGKSIKMEPNWEQNFIIAKNNVKGEKLYNEALGGKVEAVTKVTSNNKASGGTNMTGRNIAKILESEDTSVNTVPHDVKIAIQKARQAKGWNQKQLAEACSMKQDIIRDYENGKAIPENGVIAKMEKAMGCKLPRPPKKKK